MSSSVIFRAAASSVSAARAKDGVTSVSTSSVKSAREWVLRLKVAKRDCRMILLSGVVAVWAGSMRRALVVLKAVGEGEVRAFAWGESFCGG